VIAKEENRSFNYGNYGIIKYKVSSDFDSGKRLDTQIIISDVSFTIAGEDLENFHNDFKELVTKYFI